MKAPNLMTRRIFCLLVILALVVIIIPPTTVAAPSRDGPIVYYVQYGDTLYSIALRFGTTVQAIMAANGLSSEYIYAGQRLLIPIGGPSYPTPAAFNCLYTVAYRDTLFSISYRYKTTVYYLMQSNYLYSPYIFVGQVLKVPCYTPAPSSFPTYTVQQGDNLFRIAIQYSTSIYAIALVNGIWNPNLIFVGQNLVIPYPGTVIWPVVPTLTPSLTPSISPTGATTTATTTATATATTTVSCTGSCAVAMSGSNYIPSSLTVSVGTTVTWTNFDSTSHTVSGGTPGNLNVNPTGFRSNPLTAGQTYSFQFTYAGTFPYFSESDSSMAGTIIVQ